MFSKIITSSLNTELEIEIPEVDSDENNVMMLVKCKFTKIRA